MKKLAIMLFIGAAALLLGCSTPPINANANVPVLSPKVGSENVTSQPSDRHDSDSSATTQRAGDRAVQVRARDISIDGGTLTIIAMFLIGCVMIGHLINKGLIRIGGAVRRKK